MPKEHVESRYAGRMPQLIQMTGDVVEGSVTAMDALPPFRIEVGWDRHGNAQIATTDPDAELGSRESGLWVDVDRTGINDLIRLLRKARDQAFGRDE